jgi:hypothetical protein
LSRANNAATNTNPTESKKNQVKESHTMAISSQTHSCGEPSLVAEVGMSDGNGHPSVACAASVGMPFKTASRTSSNS